MAILIIANLAILFLAFNFFRGTIPAALSAVSLVILVFGLLGLTIVIMLTSRFKGVFKNILIIIFVGICAYGIYYYFAANQMVVEHHYAVVITEATKDDVKFSEFWFPNDGELKRFVSRTQWYAGDKGRQDRLQMLDYYYSVKAEEKEAGKNLIDRRQLTMAPAQNAAGELIAYTSERRTGAAAVNSNPRFVVSDKKENDGESQGGEP